MPKRWAAEIFRRCVLAGAMFLLLVSFAHSQAPRQQAPREDDIDRPKRTGFVAQIFFQVDQQLDDEAIQQFSPEEWQRIQQTTGAQLVPEEHVLRVQPSPATGYWLRISGRRHMINSTGMVYVPALPPVTTNLQLFVQAGDKDPFAVLPSVEFVPVPQRPKPTIFRLLQKLPASMNASHEYAHTRRPRTEEWQAKLETLEYRQDAGHSACLLPAAQQQGSGNPLLNLIPEECLKRAPCEKGDNSQPCCVDYDGPLGDGRPIARHNGAHCFAIGERFFEWSTCFIWTIMGPCANEAAYPWNGILSPAPNCWDNHKYRNCQNLDPEDFHLSPSAAVVNFGESVNLTIGNNTAGNSDCVAISDVSAKLQLTSSGALVRDPECGAYRVDHFTDRPSQHYNTVKLQFTAPRPPSPKICKTTYRIIAESGGKEAWATIVASNPKCGGWSGNITYHEEATSDYEGGPKNFETSAHQSEYLNVAIHLKNGVGVAVSDAEESYSLVSYNQVLRNQVLTRFELINEKDQGSAQGGSEASVQVNINRRAGTYTIIPKWKIAAGTRHNTRVQSGQVTNDADSPYYALPFLAEIDDKLQDPKHLDGSYGKTSPYGSPMQNGKSTRQVNWDLTYAPPRP